MSTTVGSNQLALVLDWTWPVYLISIIIYLFFNLYSTTAKLISSQHRCLDSSTSQNDLYLNNRMVCMYGAHLFTGDKRFTFISLKVGLGPTRPTSTSRKE